MDDLISRQDAQERQRVAQKRRYTFGNDEFSLEAAYHDCKLVFDGITDDDSFQEADTGLILYYANEIIYALHEALKGKDTNVHSNDYISRQAAIDVASGYCHPANIADELRKLPSAQPQTEWNNHTVACLLAELFGDDCACNYNGIDEWLPEKCEVIDACPNPVGVACWEQFLKHRAERRTDE